ncbi:MAG: peptide-methionine (S)-S-oxide reductase MsrA [Promethearchaeota archaeon]
MKKKKAIFAAGCFWGVEANFSRFRGVLSTRVGYTGGHTKDPTYKEVCSHKTGHAEAVEVVFNPEIVSYEELLDAFWSMHNPTTLNRQGPDVGSQYRSAIFYLSEEQKEKAIKSKEEKDKSGDFRRPIVTEITKASSFWEAEEYHQHNVEKHSGSGCHYTLF